MSWIDCHIPPDRADIASNAAKQPEGERIRAELEDFLVRNKIVSIMLDTQEHHVSVDIVKLPDEIQSVLGVWGSIYVRNEPIDNAASAGEPTEAHTCCWKLLKPHKCILCCTCGKCSDGRNFASKKSTEVAETTQIAWDKPGLVTTDGRVSISVEEWNRLNDNATNAALACWEKNEEIAQLEKKLASAGVLALSVEDDDGKACPISTEAGKSAETTLEVAACEWLKSMHIPNDYVHRIRDHTANLGTMYISTMLATFAASLQPQVTNKKED